MTKRWITILILFLLVGNAALVTTLIVKNNTQISEKINAKRRGRDGNKKKCSSFELKLAKELNFDTAQQQQVNVLSTDFHEKQKTYKKELRKLKKRYTDELSQASPDTVFLHKIALNIGEIEASRIKLDYEHYRNIRLVCTAEQALEMDSIGRVHMRSKFKDKGSENPRRHGDSKPENNN